MPYDHGKYGHRQRKWFGLGPKWGGDAMLTVATADPMTAITKLQDGEITGGFPLGTHDPGTLTHVAKWYPEGPIKIKKIGVFCCATINNASGGLPNFQFLTRGASASVIGAVQLSSCTVSEGTLDASKTYANLTVANCKAGEYITIKSYEPTTKTKATEVKATTSGRVAFFIDYVPWFVVDGTQWSA